MDEEWVASTYEGNSDDDTAPLPLQHLHHGMREPSVDVAVVNRCKRFTLDSTRMKLVQTMINS